MIIDSDHPDSLSAADLAGVCPLTCGLSLRATVTVSSIGEEGFTYCLQRSIFTLGGEELPPQEFNVRWREKPQELYPSLALVTILLVCGISPEVIASLEF